MQERENNMSETEKDVKKEKKTKAIKLKNYKLPQIAELDANQTVNSELYAKFQKDFAASAANKVIASAICNVGIAEASFNNNMLRDERFVFSNETKRGGITNQKQSGRCWLFAALNEARVSIMETLQLDDFELSENYMCFYEKMEKSNAFLENIIATLNKDVYSRDFDFVKDNAAGDGGFFEWYADLVTKYGVVPKACMPETFHSSNTTFMVEALNERLYRTAMQMRNAYAAAYPTGEEPTAEFVREMRQKKEACLSEIYNICVKSLGEPPTTVNFAYMDKKKKKQEIKGITPKEFYEKYCGLPLEDMVVLTNDPTERFADGTAVTYKYCQLVQEGKGLLQLLAPMEELTAAAVKSIKAGQPMWFACDVGKSSDRKKGYLDHETYLTDLTLTPVGEFSKKDRTIIGETQLNHAMLLCGVDLTADGEVKKWKVENSWGDTVGEKGVFSMSHQWFLNNTYQVIVNKKYVSKSILAGLKKKPQEIEPWKMICYPGK